MQKLINYLYKGALMSLFVFHFSCEHKEETSAVQRLQEQYIQDLEAAIENLIHLEQANDVTELKTSLSIARTYFKKLEPILSYLDSDNYLFLNQPNILKIDEDDFQDIKIKKPSGFQVLEELIYADSLDWGQIKTNVGITEKRLQLIKANSNNLAIKDYHFLWLIRNELIRVSTLGITGFDSPVLENSIDEARTSFNSMSLYMTFFEGHFNQPKLYQKWMATFTEIDKELQSDFVSFNRYNFIKMQVHEVLDLWNQTVDDWQVEFPFEMAISNDAHSLFADNTFNQTYFSSRKSLPITENSVLIGEKLFNDPNLSAGLNMSCASCHLKDKAFTDGDVLAFKGGRNTPTITYSALQKGMFYDKRVGNLEGQILHVVKNGNEFDTEIDHLVEKVRADREYTQLFESAGIADIDKRAVLDVIANYVRTQSPFSSRFDRNINGMESTLTEEEITGFNLFMGKGKCGTCHFAPTFNGTVPPIFSDTELESIGVPETNENLQLDDDLGRYHVYNTPERKHFFKTPTIRNVALTAPYMHNGVYETLEEVLAFYNAGGGEGLGYNVPNQTLPPDSLGLSDEEIQAIISFMNTLTDDHAF